MQKLYSNIGREHMSNRGKLVLTFQNMLWEALGGKDITNEDLKPWGMVSKAELYALYQSYLPIGVTQTKRKDFTSDSYVCKITTLDDVLIANGFRRITTEDYASYIEIAEKDIQKENLCLLTKDEQIGAVTCDVYVVNDPGEHKTRLLHVKRNENFKTNFLPTYFYVSPYEIDMI